MNNWIDYYEVLGVSKDASFEEIKKKYRDLLKEYHPDVYEGNDAHIKAALINEAYDTLSDSVKRTSYDLDYEKNKHAENDYDENEEPVDYDEVMKEYNDKEKKYAKRMALKKVIEEALIKINNVEELKNDILIAAYSNDLSEEEYAQDIEEWLIICDDYIEELNILITKASENELDSLISSIENAIEEVNNMTKNIPIGVLEAAKYVDDEIMKDSAKKQIEIDLEKARDFRTYLDTFFFQIGDNISTKKEYDAFYQKNLIEIEKMEATLLKMKKIAKLFSLEELEEIEDLLQELAKKKIEMPKSLKVAKHISKIIIFNNKVTKLTGKMTLYRQKFDKIDKIITKHPFNKRSFALAEYAEALYKELQEDMGSDYYKLLAEGQELADERIAQNLREIYQSSRDLALKTSDDFKRLRKKTIKSPNFEEAISEAKEAEKYGSPYYWDYPATPNLDEMEEMLSYIKAWANDILQSENFEEMYYAAKAYLELLDNDQIKGLEPDTPALEALSQTYKSLDNSYNHIKEQDANNSHEACSRCYRGKLSPGSVAFTASILTLDLVLGGWEIYEFIDNDFNFLYLLALAILIWPITNETRRAKKYYDNPKNHKTYKKLIEQVPRLKQTYEDYYGKL